MFMKKNIVSGNLHKTSKEKRGWIMGHFMNPDSPLKTQNCELKWGEHKKGEKREKVSTIDNASSLAILIRGEFTMVFPGKKEVKLKKEGDFVFYGPKTPHSWHVEKDCLLLTLRWPSLPKIKK
jgi:hypothetical protein